MTPRFEMYSKLPHTDNNLVFKSPKTTTPFSTNHSLKKYSENKTIPHIHNTSISISSKTFVTLINPESTVFSANNPLDNLKKYYKIIKNIIKRGMKNESNQMSQL